MSTNIFTVGGTVQAGNGAYISRAADKELLRLCREGTFAYILTARQMGKSSLMVQTARRLEDEGIRSVIIDLTQIGGGLQVTAEQWYLGQLDEIASRLDLRIDAVEWWLDHAHLSFAQRLTEFFETLLLAEIREPVVIFIDEIDTTLRLGFTDDFYSGIRYLYNARAKTPELKRLSFVLIGVATPSDLIHNPETTPFNIGQRVDLADFTFAEAMALTSGFNLPPAISEEILRWIMEWTGGHPYLTQRLCRAVSDEKRDGWSRKDIDHLVNALFFSEGGDRDNNLQFVRDMLTRRAQEIEGIDPVEVLTTYQRVRRGKKPVSDEEQSIVKSHLKLSGVVCRENGELSVRNPIYGTVFNEGWIREHLPETWTKKQLRKARTTIAGLVAILLVIGGLGVYARIQAVEAIEQGEVAQTQKVEADKQRTIARDALYRIDSINTHLQQTNIHLEARTRESDSIARRLAVEKARVVEYSKQESQLRQEAEKSSEMEKLYRNGTAQYFRGDAAGAIRTYRKALDFYTRSGDREGRLLTLMNIAAAHDAVQQDSVAIISYVDALKEADDDSTRRYLYQQIGSLHRSMGSYDSAATAYEEVARQYEKSENYLQSARILYDIGEMFAQLSYYPTESQLESLAKYFERASGGYARAGVDDSAAVMLTLIGDQYLRKSDSLPLETGYDYLKRSEEIFLRIGDTTAAMQNLSSAALEFAEAGLYERSEAIYTEISEFQARRGRLDSAGYWLELAARGYADVVPDTTEMNAEQGRPEKARKSRAIRAHAVDLYRRAMEHYAMHFTGKSLDSTRGEIFAEIAEVYKNMGETTTAREHYDTARVAFDRCGYDPRVFDIFVEIAELYSRVGEEIRTRYYTDVAEFYDDKRDSAGRSGDGWSAANYTGLLGDFYQTFDPRRSIETYQQAQSAFHALGDSVSEAHILNSTAKTYKNSLRYNSAIDTYSEGVLKGYLGNGWHGEEYDFAQYLTDILSNPRTADSLIRLFERRADRYRQDGVLDRTARTYLTLGMLYELQGEPYDVRDAYARAREIYREIGNRSGEAHALALSVHAFAGGSSYGEYSDEPGYDTLYYSEAADLFGRAGDRLNQAGVMMKLGDLFIYNRDFAELQRARSYFDSARILYAGAGDRIGQAYAEYNIADALMRLAFFDFSGDEDSVELQTIIDHYGRAAALLSDTRDRVMKIAIYTSMADVYRRMNDTENEVKYERMAGSLEVPY